MAYDEGLATRVREALTTAVGVTEKKMFGGVGFMLGGNMACGVLGDELVVRVGPEAYSTALARPAARPFDFTGRPMAGWVLVGSEGIAEDHELEDWVAAGVAFAGTLPAK